MKFSFQQKRLTDLHVQRNVLAGLSSTLLFVVLLQTFLLFFKNERLIISPPEIKHGYWVEGNRFSPSYIEEMALYFCHLLMDVSESNLIPQGEVLLRYISPEAYGSFKSKLLDDEKRLKKEQLSLHFVPQDIQLYLGEHAAEITGDLISYVAAKKISQVRETYRLTFDQKQSRLFLKSFQLIKSEKEQVDENLSQGT